MIPYVMNLDMQKIAQINKIEKQKASGIKRNIIDMTDIAILRFIYKIGTNEKVIKDTEDKEFFWVRYEALLLEYENVLIIKKPALNVRFNKYKELGLIDRKTVRNKRGTYSFFKLLKLKDIVYIKEIKNASQTSEDEDINLDTEKPYTIKEKCKILNSVLGKGYASKSLKKLLECAHSSEIFAVVNNLYRTDESYSSKYVENNLRSVMGLLNDF